MPTMPPSNPYANTATNQSFQPPQYPAQARIHQQYEGQNTYPPSYAVQSQYSIANGQTTDKFENFVQVLSNLHDDAGDKLGVFRQYGPKTLGILGGVASDGLGAAAGYYSFKTPQLASAALALKITHIEAAALLAVAVCLAGSTVTWLTTAGIRSLARSGLHDEPELRNRYDLIRKMRFDLSSLPNKTKADKQIIKMIDHNLAQAGSTSGNLKAQASATAVGVVVPALCLLAVAALAAVGGGGGGGGGDCFYITPFNANLGSGSGSCCEPRKPSAAQRLVTLPQAEQYLARLQDQPESV